MKTVHVLLLASLLWVVGLGCQYGAPQFIDPLTTKQTTDQGVWRSDGVLFRRFGSVQFNTLVAAVEDMAKVNMWIKAAPDESTARTMLITIATDEGQYVWFMFEHRKNDGTWVGVKYGQQGNEMMSSQLMNRLNDMIKANQ